MRWMPFTRLWPSSAAGRWRTGTSTMSRGCSWRVGGGNLSMNLLIFGGVKDIKCEGNNYYYIIWYIWSWGFGQSDDWTWFNHQSWEFYFTNLVAEWDVMGVWDHGIPVEMACCARWWAELVSWVNYNTNQLIQQSCSKPTKRCSIFWGEGALSNCMMQQVAAKQAKHRFHKLYSAVIAILFIIVVFYFELPLVTSQHTWTHGRFFLVQHDVESTMPFLGSQVPGGYKPSQLRTYLP